MQTKIALKAAYPQSFFVNSSFNRVVAAILAPLNSDKDAILLLSMKPSVWYKGGNSSFFKLGATIEETRTEQSTNIIVSQKSRFGEEILDPAIALGIHAVNKIYERTGKEISLSSIFGDITGKKESIQIPLAVYKIIECLIANSDKKLTTNDLIDRLSMHGFILLPRILNALGSNGIIDYYDDANQSNQIFATFRVKSIVHDAEALYSKLFEKGLSIGPSQFKEMIGHLNSHKHKVLEGQNFAKSFSLTSVQLNIVLDELDQIGAVIIFPEKNLDLLKIAKANEITNLLWNELLVPVSFVAAKVMATIVSERNYRNPNIDLSNRISVSLQNIPAFTSSIDYYRKNPDVMEAHKQRATRIYLKCLSELQERKKIENERTTKLIKAILDVLEDGFKNDAEQEPTTKKVRRGLMTLPQIEEVVVSLLLKQNGEIKPGEIKSTLEFAAKRYPLFIMEVSGRYMISPTYLKLKESRRAS